MQIHPLICAIIILLYKIGININWYTIFMLGMQFISFTIIGTIFVNKNKTFGILLYTSFIFIIYSKLLSYIQYTTVSMLCIASGLILLIDSLKDIKVINKLKFVIAILMIIIGCMIRFSTIIIALPFMVIYFICKLIKEKDIKVIKFALLLFIFIITVNISFNLIYNINPTYREFLKFHDARTYLHDYNWMNYSSNKEIFHNLGWSENDRDIFYAYCFGDEKVFNSNTLKSLEETALENRTDINLFQKILNTLNTYSNVINNGIYEYIFLITVLIVIFNNIFIILKNKNKKQDDALRVIFINLILIAVLGMHCLFIFLNRPMFRVVISIYIIGVAMLMYISFDNVKDISNKIIKNIFVILILFISILEFKQNVFSAKRYDINNFSVYREIVEYTNENIENAYLYTLVMHDRFLAYSVYEKIIDNSYSNLRPLGDWDTYTENYYVFKEKYGIDNLMESLYKNDNVYLISGDVIWGEKYKEYINIIEKYIEDHYGIDVECNIIKEFKNNIKIYKLKEKC